MYFVPSQVCAQNAQTSLLEALRNLPRTEVVTTGLSDNEDEHPSPGHSAKFYYKQKYCIRTPSL
jgi:hypothetical protein